MAFEDRSEDQIELDNLNMGKVVPRVEAIYYDSKKEKRALLKRVKKFMKAHRNVRLVIKPEQIWIQDIKVSE